MTDDNPIADREWGLELPASIAPEPDREPTVANWVEEFKLACFHRLAYATRLSIERTLQQFALWAGTRQLTGSLVIEYCNEQAATAKSLGCRANKMNCLRSFLKWCERMGYCKTVSFLVPVVHAPLPAPKVFTAEQYAALKEEAKGTVWYYACVTAYRTGMRLSDVCLLRWDSIDLENMVINYVPFKTRKRGIRAVCPIEVGSDLHEVILDMDKARSAHPMWSAYVCPVLAMSYPKDGDGHSMAAGEISKWMFAKFCRAVEGSQRLSFHKLRNSFMSRMVNADLSWARACQITGLQTFSVFLRYAKPDVDALRKDMAKMSRVEAEQAANSVKLLEHNPPPTPLVEGEHNDD